MRYAIKSLYILLTVIGIVAVSGLMLSFLSCRPVNEPAAAQESGNSCPVIVEREGDDSDMVIDNAVKRAVPIIDTRVPAETETATFALG